MGSIPLGIYGLVGIIALIAAIGGFIMGSAVHHREYHRAVKRINDELAEEPYSMPAPDPSP